jgi:two-component system chemotaxis response regulator CheB
MESAAAVYGASTLGVVLTGMGSDGTRGAGLIKAAGGEVIAQDASTSAVYGMPKSVAEAGHADNIVPLPRIASEIVRRCRARPRR